MKKGLIVFMHVVIWYFNAIRVYSSLADFDVWVCALGKLRKYTWVCGISSTLVLSDPSNWATGVVPSCPAVCDPAVAAVKLSAEHDFLLHTASNTDEHSRTICRKPVPATGCDTGWEEWIPQFCYKTIEFDSLQIHEKAKTFCANTYPDSTTLIVQSQEEFNAVVEKLRFLLRNALMTTQSNDDVIASASTPIVEPNTSVEHTPLLISSQFHTTTNEQMNPESTTTRLETIATTTAPPTTSGKVSSLFSSNESPIFTELFPVTKPGSTNSSNSSISTAPLIATSLKTTTATGPEYTSLSTIKSSTSSKASETTTVDQNISTGIKSGSVTSSIRTTPASEILEETTHVNSDSAMSISNTAKMKDTTYLGAHVPSTSSVDHVTTVEIDFGISTEKIQPINTKYWTPPKLVRVESLRPTTLNSNRLNPDKQPFAIFVGTFAIIVIAIFVLGIFLMDIRTIIRDLRRMKKNVSSFWKRYQNYFKIRNKYIS